MKFKKIRESHFMAFSKSEFRGFLVLMLIMVVLIFLRYRQQRREGSWRLHFSDLPAEVNDPSPKAEAGNQPAITGQQATPRAQIKLDPNAAGYDALVNAGFSSYAATNLIRYREKGGMIREAGDLRKIYGVDSVLLNRIAMNLILPDPAGQETAQLSETELVIELNSVDSATLRLLPGIGEVLSSRIVRYREWIGGFHSATQLTEVFGINDSLVDRLRPFLRINPDLIRKLDLNRATFRELNGHPYLGAYQARAILKFRELMKGIDSCNQLIINNIITEEEYNRLAPYLMITPF